MYVCTTRSTVFTHEFIGGAVATKERIGLETTGRRLIVGDTGGER